MASFTSGIESWAHILNLKLKDSLNSKWQKSLNAYLRWHNFSNKTIPLKPLKQRWPIGDQVSKCLRLWEASHLKHHNIFTADMKDILLVPYSTTSPWDLGKVWKMCISCIVRARISQGEKLWFIFFMINPCDTHLSTPASLDHTCESILK